MDNNISYIDKFRLNVSNFKNFIYNDNNSESSESESDDEFFDYENENQKDIIDETKYIRSKQRPIIYPQFENVDTSLNKNFISVINKHYEYNNKNAHYLKFTEIDCYKYPNTTITKDFNKPIIYRGFCHSMKAIKQWNIDNISRIFGPKKIALEKYNSFEGYCNHFADKHILQNMDFFINYVKNTIKNGFIDDSINYYAGEVSIAKFKNKKIYDYIINHKLKRPIFDSTIFAGAKYSGSQTHIHLYDDYILNQIIGTKVLYFTDINENIENGLGLSCPFDNNPKFLVFNKNFQNKSKFTIQELNDMLLNIDFLDHSKFKIYKVILNPGDSIVIPPWWFHNAISYDDFTLGVTHKIARNNISYLYQIPALNQYISIPAKAERRIYYLPLLKIILNILYFTHLLLLFNKLKGSDSINEIKYFTLFFLVFFCILIYSITLKYIINIFHINIHFIPIFIITTILYFIISDILFETPSNDKPNNYDILTDTYFDI